MFWAICAGSLELATELVNYFAEWNWHGLFTTNGNSTNLVRAAPRVAGARPLHFPAPRPPSPRPPPPVPRPRPIPASCRFDRRPRPPLVRSHC